LGAVSISLKRLGFNICALDIPEFYQSSTLRALYERNGIPFNGLNLRKSELPYGSDSFDAVIICEVLEHLNFNPLPALQEINRVLKNDGYIYIGMPNQTCLGNREKLLRGMSIHNSIEDFFKQLARIIHEG
jgi:SAM-dependent methyltransferase